MNRRNKKINQVYGTRAAHAKYRLSAPFSSVEHTCERGNSAISDAYLMCAGSFIPVQIRCLGQFSSGVGLVGCFRVAGLVLTESMALLELPWQSPTVPL